MNALKRWHILPVLALMTVAVAATAQSADQAAEPPAATEPMPTANAPRVTIDFGRGLDQATRSLVDPGEVFPADVERVWCMTRVEGLTPPTSVTHVWYHDGQTKAKVDLNIGSQNWRTWSSKLVLAGWTGRWEVKVLDVDGTVIGSAAFEIREP